MQKKQTYYRDKAIGDPNCGGWKIDHAISLTREELFRGTDSAADELPSKPKLQINEVRNSLQVFQDFSLISTLWASHSYATKEAESLYTGINPNNKRHIGRDDSRAS